MFQDLHNVSQDVIQIAGGLREALSSFDRAPSKSTSHPSRRENPRVRYRHRVTPGSQIRRVITVPQRTILQACIQWPAGGGLRPRQINRNVIKQPPQRAPCGKRPKCRNLAAQGTQQKSVAYNKFAWFVTYLNLFCNLASGSLHYD